jgi:aspartate kinase
MAILSLVGSQMRKWIGIASSMFAVLADQGINIEMISQGASEINISCVIAESQAIKALNIVHDEIIISNLPKEVSE